MQYIRPLTALGASLLILAGCAGDTEYARGISRDQALDECRKMADASAYLECKKRADQMHARR